MTPSELGLLVTEVPVLVYTPPRPGGSSPTHLDSDLVTVYYFLSVLS